MLVCFLLLVCCPQLIVVTCIQGQRFKVYHQLKSLLPQNLGALNPANCNSSVLPLRHVVKELGTAIRVPTCSRHLVCSESSFPSSSLQISKGYNVRDSAKLRFGRRRSQPSSSFFTVLPEDCSSKSNRHSRVLTRRSARNKDGAPSLDKQCLLSATTGAEGKCGSVGNVKVEIFEDGDDETGDRVL